jgi:hypothetical protein
MPQSKLIFQKSGLKMDTNFSATGSFPDFPLSYLSPYFVRKDEIKCWARASS